MATDETYTRTIQVPVEGLTANKAGKLAAAMKDYRTARQQAIQHFRTEASATDMTLSERNELRKAISSRDDVALFTRTAEVGIKTVQQNYAEFEKGTFDTEPEAKRADTLALEGSDTRLFHSGERYYLDIPTGRGSILCPLRVTDDAWHDRRFPDPEVVSFEGRSRCGVEFADIDADDFPDNTVKLSTSTLSRTGERSFVANLVFQHKPRMQQPVEEPRFVIGVDRGRNQLLSAAVYDVERDHVVDWLNMPGDEVEHYMDRFAERIREFQKNKVWEQMEDARERRFAYKRQQDYNAANRVVDMARERFGVQIALENLSDMSRLGSYSVENRRFSEWSYGRLRDAIARKAEPYGISVVTVKPEYTSQTCSRCGADDTSRSGVHFECNDCKYEQHADANAAVNIAKRAAGVGPLAARDKYITEVEA